MAKKKSKPQRAVPSPRMSAQDKKWQAESDLRSLREVEAIRGDKPRMKAAQSMAQKEMSALKKISKG